MNSLLVINSSGRVTRSITRHLAARFVDAWTSRRPDAEIVTRDVGVHPPPTVNEAWIAAAFAAPSARTPAMRETLALSDELIDEILRADAIVAGVPMYNFGAPAQFKAYIDQIVRVGRTFAFNAGEADPYQPLIPSKPLVIIAATGAGGYEPGGSYAHLNFLEPHLKAVFEFIGLTDISFVRVGFEEFQNHQFKQSIAAAESAVEAIVDRLAGAATPRIEDRELIPSHSLS
jgi:FMN-dependent NADH-azoreductase